MNQFYQVLAGENAIQKVLIASTYTIRIRAFASEPYPAPVKGRGAGASDSDPAALPLPGQDLLKILGGGRDPCAAADGNRCSPAP